VKITVERDAFLAALNQISGRVKADSSIPILSHVLVDARDDRVSVTANNLSCCCSGSVPAEIEREGAIALPSDRLSKLLAGSAHGGQVVIEADSDRAKVKVNRSNYQFATLPATDFPENFEPQDPTTLTITPVEATRLFKVPASCVGVDQGRPYLHGIFLHWAISTITACATDGHRLVRTQVAKTSDKFDGVIVPDFACAAIAKLADLGDIKLRIGHGFIAAAAGDIRYVSKLIDGTFPDYSRVIPEASSPHITVDSSELDAALSRLLAACDPKGIKTIKLSWDDNPSSLAASINSDLASGEEELECDTAERSAGYVGMQMEYLRAMIDAAGGKTVRLFVGASSDPMRIEAPHAPDFVGVIMPVRVN
jgi:DNA polymerase-3 subunit beta